MMKPGKPVHPSNGVGTATATPVEISFDLGANRNGQSTGLVVVTNTTAAAGAMLGVSFAGGKGGTYFYIPPQTTVSFPVVVYRCTLVGISGSATYSVMGVII
jgi:hypothetical protein